MKRIVIALAAIAVAAVAAVGVARVAGGDPEPTAQPSTSRDRGADVSQDFDRQQLKDQAVLQANQVQKARAELARAVKEYAEKHAQHTG